MGSEMCIRDRVTGAAKGIGLATVKRLLKKEAKVILWDFQADDLASTVQSLKNEGHDVFSQVCVVEELSTGL